MKVWCRFFMVFFTFVLFCVIGVMSFAGEISMHKPIDDKVKQQESIALEKVAFAQVKSISVELDQNEQRQIFGENQLIKNFVKRLYRTGLSRFPDEDGFAFWIDALASGEYSGAQVACEFLISQEIQSKNLYSEEYIILLYDVLLDRESDAEGLAYWQQCMNEGCSKTGILRRFLLSEEFLGICNLYGIRRGDPDIIESRDINLPLTMFIYQMYQDMLERQPEASELNVWADYLINHERNLETMVLDFVQSEEFIHKEYTDDRFFQILFELCADERMSDLEMQQIRQTLKNNASRSEVAESFVVCESFRNKILAFGLQPIEERVETENIESDPLPIHSEVQEQISIPVVQEDEVREEVIRLVNEYRQHLGYDMLNNDNRLNQAARIRAGEIISLFEHQRPDGRDVWTLFDEVGYTYSAGGENIAICGIYVTSKETADHIFNLWKNSPAHEENMLDSIYRDIGVGIVIDGGRVYGVQLFGKSK